MGKGWGSNVHWHMPVARSASILLGELVAIKIALDQVRVEAKKRRF